ncbi:PAS domain S-box protein [Methanocalculus sp.]|uniref:response regulator n=1 Tax=Methanocalculus sp. TaxID=2004547 RepID=UPI00271B4C5C|nr:PAS domain S-box protein [Methanocalculus sp.]MDO8841069.1 PAS domain S-box protein [Methanocalculus sp.]
MTKTPIQILYVDDEPALLEIGRLFLEKSGDITVKTALSAPEAIRLLSDHAVDAIVSDYQMPGMDGIALLKHLRSGGERTPFIIFTGKGREDVVIEALNNGADFYLQKGGYPKALFAELSHMIWHSVKQRQAEVELTKSEERFRHGERVLQSMLNATPAGVGLLKDRVFQRVNRSLCTITGYSEEELIGKDPRMLYPDEGEYLRIAEELYQQIGEGGLGIAETRSRKKDGSEIIVILSLCPFNSDTMADGITATIIDITESRRAEEALQKSEKNFRELVTMGPFTCTISDVDGRYTFVNQKFEELAGYTSSEAIGKRPDELGFITNESYQEIISQLRRTAIIDGVESEITIKDGSTRSVHISSRYIHQGEKPQIITAIIDITERKQAEAELQGAHEELKSQDEELRMQYDALAQTQNEWESTFNTISDWVSLITPDGEILQTNKAIEPLLGVPADEVPGRKCFELVHGTACPIPECPLQRMMVSRRQEISVIPKQNGTGWLEVTLDPVMNPNKEIVRAVHIVRDITETMRTQKALENAKKKLNLLNYVTFNDLQNMILTISGYQQVVREMLPEHPVLPMITKQEEILQKVGHSLKFAQSYQGLGLKPAIWQNVRHIFLMAISHLDFLRIRHTIRFDNLEVFSDPLFEQVFLILADNTLTHGASAENVVLTSITNEDSITILYEDDGIGIPDEIKDKVFLADFQKKKGVGLFFSREILEITGIAIRETGVYGEGARFEMTIPKGTWRYAGDGE